MGGHIYGLITVPPRHLPGATEENLLGEVYRIKNRMKETMRKKTKGRSSETSEMTGKDF
jgi:hypothetical protein